ncbi:MAG TPA: ABC transporter substrate-binding protein, partial [Thermodesulfobacteriota bacterium]|nr:ABC transporter substrate-binding protein [Thermodesulfobacteriota bacterium]
MRKVIFIITVFFVFTLTLVPGTGWTQDKKPVKIGVPVTLSGMGAQVGVDNRNGIMLAAKQKKTVLGRPIELVIEDEEGK